MASSCWESASFARGGEFEPGLRHKKRPRTEASSMLDKSFCAKPDKWVWPTTTSVVTQTHLSRIAQKSLSVLCREKSSSRAGKEIFFRRRRRNGSSGARKVVGADIS